MSFVTSMVAVGLYPEIMLSKVGSEFVTEKETGYTNPYKHLKSFVSGGD